MAIITKKEFSKATKLDKIPMPGLASLIMELMNINDINRIYEMVKDRQGVDFVDACLDHLGIKVEIDESELKNIPSKGAFVAIANHPYGGIEGLIMLKILCTVRPETKLMSNFLLKKIPNLAEYFIAVNPFEQIKTISSLTGIKQCLEILQNDNPLGIFPAGEVSAFERKTRKVIDKKWSLSVGKIIAKAKVPVLPIYFHGNNGLMFNVLGMIHPTLRTVRLPHELFNKQGNVIKLRIGKPIAAKDLEGFDNAEKMLSYLRAKTYALGSGTEVKRFHFNNPFKIKKEAEDIILPIDKEKMASIVDKLRAADYKVAAEKNYEVYVAPTHAIGEILQEIGRLREVTFRQVGEGTNKSLDLDEYDFYYNHLFIWDTENNAIVGAYRIGRGDEIFFKYGIKGFYINTLFKIKKQLYPLMEQSVELGRSFVAKEYQLKPLPLMLLWKGILIFLIKNPEYRYLVGPVSISNDFSKFSKSLMIDFFTKNYFDEVLAQYVTPDKAFVPTRSHVNTDILIEKTGDNIKSLDSIISDVEPNHSKMPVLVRQYLNIGAKLISFNIDPKFNNSLDGFLVLDLNNVPKETIEMLSKG